MSRWRDPVRLIDRVQVSDQSGDEIGLLDDESVDRAGNSGELIVGYGIEHREEVIEAHLVIATRSVNADQMSFLFRRKLGLLPAKTAFGLGNCHPFSSSGADEVSFELGDLAEHVEQKPADRVGRVVDAAAEVERDAFRVSSSARSRASGRERASRSSFVTTSVAPARHAARASRKPGRARLAPGSPWST